MTWLDILLIVLASLVAIGAGLFFLNRWANRRYSQQQEMVQKNKQSIGIYVIDKKRDKAENVTLPKAVMENLPRTAKVMKMNFVKAKIQSSQKMVGSPIQTLICDKNVYAQLEPKKNYQVEVAGIYIVGVKGAKSAFEKKEAARAKKAKAKIDARLAKGKK